LFQRDSEDKLHPLVAGEQVANAGRHKRPIFQRRPRQEQPRLDGDVGLVNGKFCRTRCAFKRQ
jgi:hypothetical protein